MSDYIYSISMIAPDEYRDSINQLGEILGYGSPYLSVPMSEDGYEPATHWGGHTFSTQKFVDILTNGSQGIIPQSLADSGFSGEQVSGLLSQLEVFVQPNQQGKALQNFISLANSLNLQRVQLQFEAPEELEE